ncbi:MAG: IS3 family transposase [Arcobacteraceae bacterium]|nr:IS3 family transposase [Arcobacteraceae bacterium]
MESIMSRKKGQVFTAEQKSKIILELIKEEKTVSQLASQYQVTAKTITNWKKQFIDNMAIAFEPAKAVSEFKNEINELTIQNDELAKALGKATLKADFAVKKLKSLGLCDYRPLVEPKHKLSIQEQLSMFTISKSSYYYTPKPMNEENIKILNAMDEIATDNSEYGYRFIHQQLLEDGFTIGKDRVLKYMNILGIKAIYPHKKTLTSKRNKERKIYKYLLGEYWSRSNSKNTVNIPTPNEVWSGDITYIRTPTGMIYLAAIIDWNSKAILSYKISNTMDATLACDVLNDALSKYPSPKIFNSDQGSQYTSHQHINILKEHNILISMNGKARSIHNIVIERFFRTLKYNNIYISDYQTIKDLKEGVKNWIYKYNFKRFHSSIDYKKPMNVYLDYVKNVA